MLVAVTCATALRWVSRVDAFILYAHTTATTPVLPENARYALFSSGLRSSTCSDDLDRYIGLFEAYSAFNFHCGLHARWFAQRTFCIKGFNGSIARPHCLDCFRLERKLPGGLSSSHWI